MPDTILPNVGLVQAQVGASEDTWGDTLNNNWALVDATFKGDGTGTSVGLKVGTGKTLNLAGGVVTLNGTAFPIQTFTPTLDTDGTGFSSVTYDAARYGRYIDFGSFILAWGRVVTDAVTIGPASDNVVLAGFPIACNAVGLQSAVIGYSANWGGGVPSSAAMLAGTTQLALYKRLDADGSAVPLAVADVGVTPDDNDIVFFVAYLK